MPSTKACDNPAVFAASEMVLSRSIWASCPFVMPSQPSHCPSSAPVHSEASRAQSFRTLACARHRSEEHTSELQSQSNLVCRLLLDKKKDSYSHRLDKFLHVVMLRSYYTAPVPTIFAITFGYE